MRTLADGHALLLGNAALLAGQQAQITSKAANWDTRLQR
jgi:hypothetical protein